MFNRLAIKYYHRLLIFSLALIMLVSLGGRFFPSWYSFPDAILLTAGFALVAFLSLLIFFNGYFSTREKSVFMTLAALGMKMLLSFVLALLFMVVSGNDKVGSVILFFVLYLAFTFCVIRTFSSTLKRKSD